MILYFHANQRTQYVQQEDKCQIDLLPARASGDNCEKAWLSQATFIFLKKPLYISYIHTMIYPFNLFMLLSYTTFGEWWVPHIDCSLLSFNLS